jgi:hypothetical protein
VTCPTNRLRKHRILAFALVCAAGLALASCATQPQPEVSDVPGFWSGLRDGFLIVISFVVSLFTDHRIYSFPNSGVWYDFGYLLGASMFLGGGGASSGRNFAGDGAQSSEQILQ